MVDVTFDLSPQEGSGTTDPGMCAFLGARGTEFALARSRELPMLRPVCIVFKKLLHLARLNKPYAGIIHLFITCA